MSRIPELSRRLHIDSYLEGGLTVFTEKAHLARGSCCGSGCRHCPFLPKGQKGNRNVDSRLRSLAQSLDIQDLALED